MTTNDAIAIIESATGLPLVVWPPVDEDTRPVVMTGWLDREPDLAHV